MSLCHILLLIDRVVLSVLRLNLSYFLKACRCRWIQRVGWYESLQALASSQLAWSRPCSQSMFQAFLERKHSNLFRWPSSSDHQVSAVQANLECCGHHPRRRYRIQEPWSSLGQQALQAQLELVGTTSRFHQHEDLAWYGLASIDVALFWNKPHRPWPMRNHWRLWIRHISSILQGCT